MTAPVGFGARLVDTVDRRGPLCVGIDPHAALLAAWGLDDDVDGLQRFADTCVEALAGTVAVIKPQSAFFERFGSRGVAVLERTVAACRAGDALVLLDVKRGDIGSTMTAYAEAYLAPAAPLAADAMTVSPYLGVGSLQPVFDLIDRHGAGAFVLAATSNPEGPQFQHACTADGRLVAQAVVDDAAARNAAARNAAARNAAARSAAAHPLGPVGVVAGATIEPGVLDFDGLNGPILAPGVGAQGGTADDVRRVFGGALRHVLPSVSREVLRAGPDITALRDAVDRLVGDFAFLRA